MCGAWRLAQIQQIGRPMVDGIAATVSSPGAWLGGASEIEREFSRFDLREIMQPERKA